MNKGRLLLLAFTLLLLPKIKAQHKFPDAAYLITTQGDTIKGFVNEGALLLGETVFVQVNRRSRLLRSYYLKEIVKIVVDPDKIYFPRQIRYKNQQRLTMMRLTMKGEVSILFARFGKKEKRYYLEKNGEVYGVNAKNFKGFISSIYKDCDSWKSLYPGVKQINYTYETLLKLTLAYNECKNSQRPSTIYVPPEKRGAFYGLRVAAVTNEVILPEISYYSELDARTTYIGGGFILGYQANNNLILRSELNLIQRGARQTEVNVPPLSLTEVVSDFDFDFAYLELAMLLQYNFGSRSLNGYFIVGPAVSHILWSNTTELRTTDNGIMLGQETELSSGLLLGVYGGGGISYAINNQYDVFVEGRYGIGLKKLRSAILTWDLRLTTFQLGVGVTRRIGGTSRS